MICKTFEIRDRGTCFPALAIKLAPVSERDRLVLRRGGFGQTAQNQSRYILFASIASAPFRFAYDPYDQKGRTLHNAHLYIESHFDDLESGAVIDVEFILGESDAPKQSELDA